jgi:hypothetical protein
MNPTITLIVRGGVLSDVYHNLTPDLDVRVIDVDTYKEEGLTSSEIEGAIAEATAGLKYKVV